MKTKTMQPQILKLDGKRFVVMEETEYRRLRGRRTTPLRPIATSRSQTAILPPMPPKLPSGNYPALEGLRVVLARKLITARSAAGWSQAELARKAGIRNETLNRIEKARNTPDAATMNKLQKALHAAGINV